MTLLIEFPISYSQLNFINPNTQLDKGLDFCLEHNSFEYHLDTDFLKVESCNLCYLNFINGIDEYKDKYKKYWCKKVINGFRDGLLAFTFQDVPEGLISKFQKVGIVSASQIVAKKKGDEGVYNITIFNPTIKDILKGSIETYLTPGSYQIDNQDEAT